MCTISADFFCGIFNGKDIVKNICYNSFIMATRIQVRRDSAANWTSNNPTLAEGEIGFETDTGKFKIGKSNTAWTSLQYAQVAGDDGLSYDIYPTVDSNGLTPPSNSGISMDNLSIGASYSIYGADTLFKAGDWIKLVYMDRPGGGGNGDNTIYPDVFVEGYIWEITKYPESNYNEYRFTATKINGGSQEGNIIDEWTTGLLPEPKATYEFPAFIYPVGDSLAGVRTAPPLRPVSVGDEYVIEGQPGLYQVGQKIRMQSLDEFGVAIPLDYSILEVLSIQKYIEGTQTDGLEVKCLEVYVDSNSLPYSSSFSLHASDGPQGPGYEVTWDENIHSYPDDPDWLWEEGKTTWKAGDQYNIPGDFVNTAYKVGDYIRYYFQYSTGNYDDEINSWIEGWITDINTAGATIRVQRWANTDWLNVSSNIPPNTRTTYAHFEPGYNFDTYLSENTNPALNDPLSYEYLSYQIQNDPYFYFILRGHLGSYKAGDYVIVSSKSNPLIKFTAYLVHAGLAGINAYTSNFYPIEILSWDGEEDAPIEDWTLSPTSPPEVGYNFPFPLPNPSVATYDTPVYSPPANFIPPNAQTYPLSIDDIIQVRGVPGLYEIGDKVKAYDPYDKDAEFFGEVYSLGSASNEWISEIKVTDPSIFTSSNTNYHPYKISLATVLPDIPGYNLEVPAVYLGYIQGGPRRSTVSWKSVHGTESFLIGTRVRATLMSDPTKYVEGPLVEISANLDGSGPETLYGVYFGETDTNTTGYSMSAGLGSYDDPPSWTINFATTPAPIETKDINLNINNITVTAEDMGKYIYSYSGDPVTVSIDVDAGTVPFGSQVTVIQRWSGPVTITSTPTSGVIYFSETDGYTDGEVTLKGQYSAATIVNAEGYWIVIGSFASANYPPSWQV